MDDLKPKFTIEVIEKMNKPFGKLKNGKLFYESAHHPAHKTFTAEEHAEAAQHLSQKGHELLEFGNDHEDPGSMLGGRSLLIAAKNHGEKAKQIGLPQASAEQQARMKEAMNKPATNRIIKKNEQPKKYVHVDQHHGAVINGKPNPVSGRDINHLNDLKALEAYHGRPMHRFSDSPSHRWGHGTYEVQEGGKLKHLGGDYDTSD